MLNNFGHEIVEQKTVFERDGPRKGRWGIGGLQDGGDGAGIEIFDKMVQARLADPHDEAADDPVPGKGDGTAFGGVGDGYGRMPFLASERYGTERQIVIPFAGNFYFVKTEDVSV